MGTNRYVYEGQTRIALVPASVGIADIAAPTLVELTDEDVVDLSRLITKDGLNTPQNQNMVDSATLAEIFDSQLVGSWGGAFELTCFRARPGDDGLGDKAWDTFNYGEEHHAVIRRGVPYDQEWADGDRVEVYPIQSHQPIMQPSAANEQQRFVVSCAVTEQPDLKAVVGGGS